MNVGLKPISMPSPLYSATSIVILASPNSGARLSMVNCFSPGIEAELHAAGFLAGEQGCSPDGTAQHIAIEHGGFVLILGNHIFVGREGALDQVACEDRTGATRHPG